MDSAKPVPAVGAVNPPATIGALPSAVPPFQRKITWEEHLELIEHYVEELKAPALIRDRIGFSRLLRYPFNVNTPSRCVAEIPNAEVFLSHFDAIVTARVRRAILEAKPPIWSTYRASMLGNGEVWMDEVEPETGAVGVTVVNSSTWRITDLPCKSEAERPVPSSLGGRWRVTSFCDMVQSQMIPRATKTWLGRSVEFDLDAGQALVGVEPGARVSCHIGRYGERVPTGDSGRPGLGAERCGLLGDDGRGFFLDLECRDPKGGRYIERVDVLSDSSIAIVGDDKWLLLLSPEGARRRVNDQSKGD